MDILTGYSGKFLYVNLTKNEIIDYEYPSEWKEKFIGGRGFATKYLWDNLKPGTDPLGPDNILIFAIGPLSGLSLPSSSKMIVASKSPLTGGYGDGNLGTRASPQLKRAGYDGIIIIGKAEKPVFIEITSNESKIHDAKEIWGKGTYETEKYLIKRYNRNAGFLSIGQGGENLVRYATVRSQEGRSGGRPGMGAVMGSKNLKSIVVMGRLDFPIIDPKGVRELGKKGYDDVKNADFYDGWMKAGTTMILEWCQETSTLPTRNFQEGQFEGFKGVDGDMLSESMTERFGCPKCTMQCGIAIEDENGNTSELDYENIGMLGPNLGFDNLKKVGVLNYMADDYGLDTISLGSVLGMAAEASQKGVFKEAFNFGEYDKAVELIDRIAKKSDDQGELLGMGTKFMSEKWGGEAKNWAMQVKGLECSAYNAFTIPGMALSFGTSPIGAHHKDAWVISYEISEMDRGSYDPAKADKVIELQRIRGGMFESLVTCRFPWIELGYDLEEYPKFLHKVTGDDHWTLDEIFNIADRIYALIRAFWVREYLADGNEWDRKMDYPPQRWFNDALQGDGPYQGVNLDEDKYDVLLSHYYDKRGWDDRGIPTKSTFDRLDLSSESEILTKTIELK